MNHDVAVLPPMPVFDIRRVEALRGRLIDEAGFAFLEDELTGDAYQRFVDAVAKVMPSTVSRDILFDSCRSILGRRLTLQRMATLAWRLAGNVPRLRKMIPVHPWTQQTSDEWIPVHVEAGVYAKSYRGELACDFAFRAMAGTVAPKLFRQQLTKKHCSMFATRLGFTTRRAPQKRRRPFVDSMQFVGLRFCVLIEMSRSHDRPTFFHMAVPPKFKEWNTELLEMRYRHGWDCPKGYHHACHNCVIGQDQCPAATHQLTHVLQFCSQCQRDEVRFDPERSTELCVACLVQQQLGQGN
jgi:hypothetical protein